MMYDVPAAAPAVISGVLSNILCSFSAKRYTRNPLMIWRWILLFLLTSFAYTFYLFTLPW